MFRPVQTLWLEMLIEHEAAPAILTTLAKSGSIELQHEVTQRLPIERVEDKETDRRIQQLTQLKGRYSTFLPHPDPAACPKALHNVPAQRALAFIQHSLTEWNRAAGPLTARLRKINTELEHLALAKACLEALPDDSIDLSYFNQPSRHTPPSFTPWLAWSETVGADIAKELPEDVLLQIYPVSDANHLPIVLLGVCETKRLQDIERTLHASGVRFARLPGDITGTPNAAQQQILAHSHNLTEEKQQVLESLQALQQRTRLAGALWLLERHQWLEETLQRLGHGRRFLWLTGWVPPRRLDMLVSQLEQTNTPFLLHSNDAIEQGPAPVVLENPPWIKKFEIFAKSFGMPAREEVDPSPILALAMPLMFGYMFGDVGQGAVLMLIGWLLRHRAPVFGLLIPAGFSAIIFGFLFGTVFFHEQWLTPLWMSPLDAPILLLILPLAFGVVMILASMVFAGIEAYWRHEEKAWWTSTFPLLVMYAAIPILIVSYASGVSVIMLALGWLLLATVIGGVYAGGLGAILVAILGATGKAVLVLVEALIQLATNTISFARIGAFALAHAGLGLTVVALADMVDHVALQGLIWILGNGLVIALEGLIVSIQTTRLIMFEFFRRFLRAEGRPFRPLTLPEGYTGEEHLPGHLDRHDYHTASTHAVTKG